MSGFYPVQIEGPLWCMVVPLTTLLRSSAKPRNILMVVVVGRVVRNWLAKTLRVSTSSTGCRCPLLFVSEQLTGVQRCLGLVGNLARVRQPLTVKSSRLPARTTAASYPGVELALKAGKKPGAVEPRTNPDSTTVNPPKLDTPRKNL